MSSSNTTPFTPGQRPIAPAACGWVSEGIRGSHEPGFDGWPVAVIYISGERVVYSRRRISAIPVFLTLLLLPNIQFIRIRAGAGRQVAGRCTKCGYDLRASPERCPECGTVRPSVAQKSVGEYPPPENSRWR